MTTIADRFEIESVAGEGGMGIVYRARDLGSPTHATVALKVVRGAFANARFEREATLLAELEGEGIVRYVAHGRIDAQSMFLAMEWLEGEALDVRLTRGPLAMEDCLTLGRRLARALGVAHARGVVHRDVKPGNVILRGGPAGATLVDFGIARAGALRAMTATGAILGTPQYMAPEQARGERLDARADVFALGCVLFECLSGRAAFIGAHVVAVLAKILLDPAERVSALRPGVPAALDELVTRLLEKSPAARPADGAAVAIALDAIQADDAPVVRSSRVSSIGTTERRLATVIMARVATGPAATQGDVFDDTDVALRGVTSEMHSIDLAALLGVTVTALASGTLVGAVVAEAEAGNAAERAIRCAIALRAELSGATISVATGRAVIAGQLPVGEAIDRAALLLEKHGDGGGIFIDEATASMIEGRFVVDRTAAAISVTGERAATERIRTVLGREIACVGRTRELALLESTFRECVDEPIARALVVIAQPGIGKTRLRRELTSRVRAWESPPAVWLALADPVTQGASYALAGDLLRRVLDVAPGDAKTRRDGLLARVARNGTSKGFEPGFIARFLGEIVEIPFGDEDEALRAARRSPELMRARLVDAASAFIGAELERHPVLLVVEDVHWADIASVRLLGSVLERLKDAPLMILALARPSVDEVHPRLWEEHRASRFVLEPLLRKAAEKLARAVLGHDTGVDAIVKRAAGNPLFVEELARVSAEGGGADDLPPTIAAAAEARLSLLSAEARQVLRASAVFGERFWPGAVGKLVGSPLASRVGTHLDALEQLEVVSAEPTSRFASEREYVFRHALVRDAAYAMLTDEDRVIGHALAAEWLEPHASDAAVLAQHFELGERRAEAARFHVIAAENALAAMDAAGIARHVASAETCAASGELLGRARLAQADMSLWNGDNRAAGRDARDAMSLVERGTARWFDAAGIAAVAFGKLDDTIETFSAVEALEQTAASEPSSGRSRAVARIRAGIQLAYFGELARTDTLLDGCEREPGADGDAGVLAWLCDAAFDRMFASGEPVHPSRFLRGRELYGRLGDRRGVVVQTSNHILTLAMLGAFAEARAALPAFESESAEIGFRSAKLIAPWIRASCAQGEGDAEPILHFQRTTRRMLPPGRGAAGVSMSLAELLVLNGHVDEAADEVAIGLSSAFNTPTYCCVLLAVSSMIKVRRDDVAGALDDSAQAIALAARGVGIANAYTPHLARYEALHAAHLEEEARAVLRDGAATIWRRAQNLAEYGPGYLKHAWRTAELMRLADEHGVAPRLTK
ncbi:MAG TPA: protein kinase [Polyangiaceae bacterium]|jgi:hypothetical protein|nr:protein kinase [Polyangiaceae bacterium]